MIGHSTLRIEHVIAKQLAMFAVEALVGSLRGGIGLAAVKLGVWCPEQVRLAPLSLVARRSLNRNAKKSKFPWTGHIRCRRSWIMISYRWRLILILVFLLTVIILVLVLSCTDSWLIAWIRSIWCKLFHLEVSRSKITHSSLPWSISTSTRSARLATPGLKGWG